MPIIDAKSVKSLGGRQLFCAGLVFFTLTSSAQTVLARPAATQTGASQFTTTPLSASDLARLQSRLDRSLVPKIDGVRHIEKTQSFAIKGPGFAPFVIVPVMYDTASGAPSPHCGVYILPEDGPASFAATLGFGDREPELCDGLLGVGFLAAASGPPQIILLYNGGSFNFPGKDPVILDWNAATHRYASNDKLVDHLGSLSTISAIKARLRALRSTP